MTHCARVSLLFDVSVQHAEMVLCNGRRRQTSSGVKIANRTCLHIHTVYRYPPTMLANRRPDWIRSTDVLIRYNKRYVNGF